MAHLQHSSHFQQNRTAPTDTSIQTHLIFIFRLYFWASIKQFDKGIVAIQDKIYQRANLCTRFCQYPLVIWNKMGYTDAELPPTLN